MNSDYKNEQGQCVTSLKFILDFFSSMLAYYQFLLCTDLCQRQSLTKSAISVTDFTTTSVSLNWTELKGGITFYPVKWNNKAEIIKNVNEMHVNVTELTLGERYTVFSGEHSSTNLLTANSGIISFV